MKLGKVVFISLFLALCLSLELFAAGSGAFLRIGVGARALGMGGAFVAIADGPTASYWNPAGLAQLGAPQLSSMYTDQFGLGIKYGFVGYAHPISLDKAWAASLIHLSAGKIPITKLDINGRPIIVKYISDSADALFLSYAQTFLSFPLGVTLKGIHQSLGSVSGWGIGFNLGSKFELFNGLYLGAVIKMGGLVWSTGEKENFPVTVTFGAAYYPFSSLVVSLDAELQSNHRLRLHVGGEYNPIPQVALRAGFNGGSPTAGVGIEVQQFQIDYALMLHKLGISHRISFGMEF